MTPVVLDNRIICGLSWTSKYLNGVGVSIVLMLIGYAICFGVSSVYDICCTDATISDQQVTFELANTEVL